MLVTVYITVADYWRIKKLDILKCYTRPSSFEKIMNKWVLPQIGMLKFTDIVKADLDGIISNIFDNGGNKNIAAQTCTILRKFFHEAATDRLIKGGICDVLKPISRDDSEKRVFSREEEKKLFIAFQHTTQPELCILSMLTGILYKDFLNCKCSDYFADDKCLKLNKKRKVVGAIAGTYKIVSRCIPLSDIHCTILNRAILKQLRKNEKFLTQRSDFIFTDTRNMPISAISDEDYNKIRKESGIYDFMMRDLVSNFGIKAIINKVNPAALKKYIGYETESSISSFSIACHNKKVVKDMTVCDEYYRKNMRNTINE